MYIWILLATLMAALSYFNLSPRPDKENYVNESKAEAEVKRFEIEHSAFIRAQECDFVNDSFRLTYLTPIAASTEDKFPMAVCSGAMCTMEPILYYETNAENAVVHKLSSYLPKGYVQNESDGIVHQSYCFDRRIGEDNGTKSLVKMEPMFNSSQDGCSSTDKEKCCRGNFVYAISFKPISNRWVSKITPEANETLNPTPTFLNYMAGARGHVGLGVVKCVDIDDDSKIKCVLQGRSAVVGAINEERVQEQETAENYQSKVVQELIIPDPIVRNADFQNECIDKSPCVFSYYKYSQSKNTADRCKKLAQKAGLI